MGTALSPRSRVRLVGEELTPEQSRSRGSVLRKHAKNAAGSGPVGQDHKEAFVSGGVQGVDGQNGRGGVSTPCGGTRRPQRYLCCPHTHPPLIGSPNSWPPEGSHIGLRTAGEGALGARFPLFSAPDLPRLGGVALSQSHPSEPQKSFPLKCDTAVPGSPTDILL